MGRTTPMMDPPGAYHPVSIYAGDGRRPSHQAGQIDTDVLDAVIRRGFPELVAIARWGYEDSLDVAIRERIPSIRPVYRAALAEKLRSACAATIGPDIDQPPLDHRDFPDLF